MSIEDFLAGRPGAVDQTHARGPRIYELVCRAAWLSNFRTQCMLRGSTTCKHQVAGEISWKAFPTMTAVDGPVVMSSRAYTLVGVVTDAQTPQSNVWSGQMSIFNLGGFKDDGIFSVLSADITNFFLSGGTPMGLLSHFSLLISNQRIWTPILLLKTRIIEYATLL